VVRRKVYLRRLAARETGKLPHSAAPSGNGAGSAALSLGQPGLLEMMVDQCLDNMVGPLGVGGVVAGSGVLAGGCARRGSRGTATACGAADHPLLPRALKTPSAQPDSVIADSSEACLVRSVTGAIAARLAAAEAGELVRSMQAALQERNRNDKDTPAAWGF
jgi:hypothetical protein